MSPVRRRRRLPTLINRGLGLLEVVMPRGAGESGEGTLPPGQRDPSGFWFPTGYDSPGAIFSPLQKQLQENQRLIQRRRREHHAHAGAAVLKGDVTDNPIEPPQPGPAASLPPEMNVPLPAPQSEAPSRRPTGRAATGPRRTPGRSRDRGTAAGSALLPDPDPRVLAIPAPIVDSRGGSD